MSRKVTDLVRVKKESRAVLTALGDAKKALAKADTLVKVKVISATAEAVRVWAQAAQDAELMNQATAVKFRAERRLGEILIRMKDAGEITQAHKGKGKAKNRNEKPRITKLEDLKIEPHLSARAQQIASVSEADFEHALDQVIASQHVMTRREFDMILGLRPKEAPPGDAEEDFQDAEEEYESVEAEEVQEGPNQQIHHKRRAEAPRDPMSDLLGWIKDVSKRLGKAKEIIITVRDDVIHVSGQLSQRQLVETSEPLDKCRGTLEEILEKIDAIEIPTDYIYDAAGKDAAERQAARDALEISADEQDDEDTEHQKD